MDVGPDPYVQLLENWMPGIGECTELHDKLHGHFRLDFSVNSEARFLLGFQLGHHPAANFLHVVIFSVISTVMYPRSYRNGWSDLRDFSLLCLRQKLSADVLLVHPTGYPLVGLKLTP